MYHGANSFAKENYRETTHAGFGCNNSVPHNHGASKYGGWRSLSTMYSPWLRRTASAQLEGREPSRVSRLKRSNVGAIVLCNAPDEVAQAAVAFLVDHAACASRSTCGCSLQAALAPAIPVLFRLCALRDCRVHSAVHFVFRQGRDWKAIC